LIDTTSAGTEVGKEGLIYPRATLTTAQRLARSSLSFSADSE